MSARILYVHGIGSIGGAERDLIALLSRLDRRIWHPAIACPETGPLREVALAQHVPTYPVNLPPWRKASSLMSRHAGVRGLHKLLADVQPALVHVNDLWWVPHTVRAVAGLSHRIPIIAHVRQETQPRKVSQYALDRVDYVVAVSHQVEQGVLTGGVESHRVRMHYSGVDCSAMAISGDNHDVRAQHGVPRQALLIGTIANLLPLKGYEVMLDALPAVLAAMPTVHYLIIGGGEAEYGTRLKAITMERGIAERVHFAGFQESVVSYLSAMDLYVHPSLKEAFGLAVVEAMAMGKAVVSTTVGAEGLPVVHDRHLLIADDPQAFANATVRLLEDSSCRTRLGRAARDFVATRFDWAAVASELETALLQAAHSLEKQGTAA